MLPSVQISRVLSKLMFISRILVRVKSFLCTPCSDFSLQFLQSISSDKQCLEKELRNVKQRCEYLTHRRSKFQKEARRLQGMSDLLRKELTSLQKNVDVQMKVERFLNYPLLPLYYYTTIVYHALLKIEVPGRSSWIR